MSATADAPATPPIIGRLDAARNMGWATVEALEQARECEQHPPAREQIDRLVQLLVDVLCEPAWGGDDDAC